MRITFDESTGGQITAAMEQAAWIVDNNQTGDGMKVYVECYAVDVALSKILNESIERLNAAFAKTERQARYAAESLRIHLGPQIDL